MEFINVKLPEEIVREEYLGNFDQANHLIERWLERRLPNDLRMRLIFEKERVKRLLKNYHYDEETAINKARELIDNFTNEEFYTLRDKGFLDYIMVDGKRMYEERFVQNIAYAIPDYQKRMKKDKSREESRNLNDNRLGELLNGDKPKEYKVRAKISLKIVEDIEEEKVKVWLPFPKEEFQQKDVKLVSASHEKYFLASSDIPQRTIYFEGKKENEYFVEFEYVIKEWVNTVVPANTEEINNYDFLSEEPPHIIFTPYLKKLAKEIVGDEKNPYLKAKKIYDWITLNVNYSYVHPYALYENIPEFVACNLKGDCGFQALLFITLCRIVGIPARWQSGWYITPFLASPHDWALFFIPPYGWLPADLSFGGRYKNNQELREFYFGNLDAFRMVANSDFMKDFTPKKVFWRNDPYDNQVGEAETEHKNIYDFKYEIQVLDFKEIRR
ncbi:MULTISPECIES: transglutaminase domain-containing protein [Thermoanaerobacter]|uniref:transglutaminase domain-containing protein n=1 Tax=Thermoanaerobacter TaxID=1754 RepID=UPI0005A21A62|nr:MULTISPECIES: transglutaminase-like domain-containing protein [Thermoanaerobacter]HAE62742.1 transglutaminase domain-containing protein [Eubacteriaceae bacterium]HBW59022.1 transglutaminase domain-containing protein [Thermoanaerobacter sp.]